MLSVQGWRRQSICTLHRKDGKFPNMHQLCIRVQHVSDIPNLSDNIGSRKIAELDSRIHCACALRVPTVILPS